MLRRLIAPPIFENDEEKTRLAGLLNTILFVQFLIPLILILNGIFIPGNRPLLLPVLVVFTLPLIGLIVLMRRGHVYLASILCVGLFLVLSVLVGYLNGGQNRPAVVFYPLIIVTSGLLLGGWSAIITAIIGSILLGLLTLAGTNGLIAPRVSPPPADLAVVTYTVGFLLTGMVLRLASNSIGVALERARLDERKLAERNRELQDLSATLEQRVNSRTEEAELRSKELEAVTARIQRRAAQFEALAQVTQNITAIRDLQELLPRITRVISESFGFYHVGIFLLDEISEFAVLIAANSEGGNRMLERNHRLRVGEEGIVGNTAFTGKPRIALDVGRDATYFNNPDLPDTHSEMALPLISKNIIVGVLDVQSKEVAAFTTEDIQMLNLLADQVSLAVENARLFDETRRALAESEMVSRKATREAWARLPEQQSLLGFRYNVTGASPLRKPVKIPQVGVSETKAEQTEAGQVVVPIELRGEVIGNLIVQSPSDKKWDQDQLDLVKAVAERVALSAENARLFEETTARADRERLVSNITGKIRSHNDPQVMIQTAIQELRSALGASRVDIVPQSGQDSENREAQGKVKP